MKNNPITVDICIILVVVIVFLAIVGSQVPSCGAENIRQNAVIQAHTYIAQQPTWTNSRVACQGVDSDGNGYVLCTVIIPSNGLVAARSTINHIECPAFWWFSWNKNCRRSTGHER